MNVEINVGAAILSLGGLVQLGVMTYFFFVLPRRHPTPNMFETEDQLPPRHPGYTPVDPYFPALPPVPEGAHTGEQGPCNK